MSNMMKRMARSVNRNAELRDGVHMVWAFMRYHCRDCGHDVNMYLEEGLEQHGEHHKPVPFGIICPKCGGFHCFDVSGCIPLLSGPRPVNNSDHFFKNTKKDDCGIPVHPRRNDG